MKKCFTIILLALVASLATAQSTQQPEDLQGIPGTEGDIIDSVLIVVNGKELPKSMNRQLINPYGRIRKIGGQPPPTFEEQMKNQHEYYDLELMRDLRAYFLRHDEHVKM